MQSDEFPPEVLEAMARAADTEGLWDEERMKQDAEYFKAWPQMAAERAADLEAKREKAREAERARLRTLAALGYQRVREGECVVPVAGLEAIADAYNVNPKRGWTVLAVWRGDVAAALLEGREWRPVQEAFFQRRLAAAPAPEDRT
jgi:hypothetical protein